MGAGFMGILWFMYISLMRSNQEFTSACAGQARLRPARNWFGGLLAMIALMGCSHLTPSGVAQLPSTEPTGHVWHSLDKANWREVRFPGKVATNYTVVQHSGQEWLRADAKSSASMLRQKIDPGLGPFSRIRFSLVVEQAPMNADVAKSDKEDAPVRVILAFDGDRSEFSARESALSELSHLMTGEPLPYATLMYVWCPQREVGSVVHNPRIDRIRKLVVANPIGGQKQHLIERDFRADYERAFGRAPGRLIGIAIMTDSDNTQGQARALYGPIEIW
jgi:Protein of unknown function (DUF3047)